MSHATVRPASDEPVLVHWVIYDHPADYRQGYVVRRFTIWRGPNPANPSSLRTYIEPDQLWWAASSTLDGARASLPPGLFCKSRHPADNPVIAETWL